MAPTQASSIACEQRPRARALTPSSSGAASGACSPPRALAGHLDRVNFLVERDALPDEAENRKGVPQGRQLHVLLARGLQVMDLLFPLQDLAALESRWEPFLCVCRRDIRMR